MRMTQRYLYYLEGVLVALAALALVPARLETATQDRHALKQEGNGPIDLRRLGSIRNNHLMLYNFYCCGIYYFLTKTIILVVSEAMVISKQPQWPWRSYLTSDLTQEASITQGSMCILPGTAVMVASEAIAASIWPQRLLLTSNLNSVASITHVPVLLWPLNGCISLNPDGRKKPNMIH